MKSLFPVILAFTLVGCVSSNKNTDVLELSNENEVAVDTMLFVDNAVVDSMSFIKLKMNHDVSYTTMADSIIPLQTDSTIALCVEAAFTGELLKDFKTTNIGGDYVIDGTFHKGYKCKANTGFLYADKTVFTISSSEHCAEWIEKAKKNKGVLFQQILILQNGKNVYRGTPIKQTTRNIYRAACIMKDGNFAVIQTEKAIPLKDFINSLIKLDVSDALYLDMGTGWNYGWYRSTECDSPTLLFNYRSPYQTNWLLIKAKSGQ